MEELMADGMCQEINDFVLCYELYKLIDIKMKDKH